MSDLLNLQEVPYTEVAKTVLEKLANGVFLTTAAENTAPNTMTIGWGGIDRLLSVPMFFAPVRRSRYTYGILQKSGEFTISVPLHNMKAELAFAGTKSGRDVNKFEGHGLTIASAAGLSTPIVKECELHFECRVSATARLTEETVSAAMLDRWYADRDMHTLFFGEILRCYYTK